MKNIIKITSLILSLLMIASSFAACTGGSVENESSSVEFSSQTEISGGDESDTEKGSNGEGEGEGGDVIGPVSNPNDGLIQAANRLANGVQAYFTNAKRTNYCLSNQEMTLNYARSTASSQLVESLTNKNGAAYVENTMDVFVRMTDGSVYYASNSTAAAEVNLYRFGYYYYEGLFENQNFIPRVYEISDKATIDVGRQFSLGNGIRKRNEEDGVSFVITDPTDPQIIFENKINYSADKYNSIIIEAKALGTTTSMQVFVGLGGYSGSRSLMIPLINDGEYHTYCISLYKLSDYAGTLTGIRLDPNGSVQSGITIKSMEIGKAEAGDVPAALNINRHFHVYSDKMHHAIQFAVTETTDNIAEVGMLTEIPAEKVSSLIVLTDDGKTYTSLDGFSWDDAVAVGFDIADAGIFGYVLPADEIAGKIKVTLTEGNYVIEQTRTPENGTIIPSIGGKNELGNYVHAEGVKNNGNDFYLGQRIYTDESHDFAEFLIEAGYERKPLSDKRINVSAENSDAGSYAGYDAMRGIYVLKLAGTGFNTAYKNPNKNYKVNFSIRSDTDREIYIMTATTAGSLECAALLDESLMLLPVPIEVIKNFSEATGERNLFNIDDPGFSEAIFCLSLEKDVKMEYTILNLYQNWGKYPLKQLSQIPYHCPYYHLSTGVTETNCILPWFVTEPSFKHVSSTLPDHRTMSAPLWLGDPQHNSCGSHTWLTYVGEDGKTNTVESQINTITSYGPTYAELVWENISDDGKIKVTYTHMEMPQTDENRTYYTMEYEFLEDLTVESFKDNFYFYNVTDGSGASYYEKLGYLNAENKSVVVDAKVKENDVAEYVLGDNCPYFTLFDMNEWAITDTIKGYANVAFLIASSEFTLSGESVTPEFLIINKNQNVSLTLNESGTVTFKAGDKIKINAILLPWGSQEYEDGVIDLSTSPKNYEYSMVLDNGELYMDKNVRDVRENTLLNPLVATSETDEILDTNFLPKVKSKDGKTATFTLSGGENNVTVRIYGFDKLTTPKVQELVDGEWVDYVLSSSATPDNKGLYHYYDGYMVNYDEDGTYSYSFVTTMYGGKSRTFRISADEDFVKYPNEPKPKENENLLTGYTDHEELFNSAIDGSEMFGTPVIGEEDGISYVSLFVKLDNDYGESYLTAYSAQEDTVSGKYMVIKYRIPTTNTEAFGRMELYSSTVNRSATAGEFFVYNPVADGEWHVVVFDLTTYDTLNFKPNDDGEYCARFIRADIFNKSFSDADNHIDIAYFGIDPDLTAICDLERDNFEFIEMYENDKPKLIDTLSYSEYIKTYLDPSSGYTEATTPFCCTLDFVTGVRANVNNCTVKNDIQIYKGAVTNADGKITLSGWCVAEGGVEKYVYSIDGGKTWIDCGGTANMASDDMISLGQVSAGSNGFTFADPEATKYGGSFQGGQLTIDLSSAMGKSVDVVFAAVPREATDTLILLFCFEKVQPKVNSIFAAGSQYLEMSLAYGAQIDFINKVSTPTGAGDKNGPGRITNEVTVNENGDIVVSGWCAVNGGVSKYVWTADGGKTWHDCTGSVGMASNEIIAEAQRRSNSTFDDAEATKVNGAFQGSTLTLDLSSYADSSEPLKIYFCAVPANSPDRVVILFTLENVDASAN